jgi:DNA (cytosine-5)-methyltransferase 1
MFGLILGDFELRRHRLFEISGFRASQPGPCRHERYALGVYGHPGGKHVMGRAEGNKATSGQAREIMRIGWMTGAEISQAVPPAYTECIGRHLMRALERAA